MLSIWYKLLNSFLASNFKFFAGVDGYLAMEKGGVHWVALRENIAQVLTSFVFQGYEYVYMCKMDDKVP